MRRRVDFEAYDAGQSTAARKAYELRYTMTSEAFTDLVETLSNAPDADGVNRDIRVFNQRGNVNQRQVIIVERFQDPFTKL